MPQKLNLVQQSHASDSFGYSAVGSFEQVVASGSFSSLPTAQSFSVTVPPSGKLLVGIAAQLYHVSSTPGASVSFSLSGANTLAASYDRAIYEGASGNNSISGFSVLLTGLNPGATTVTLLARRESTGVVNFGQRVIWATGM